MSELTQAFYQTPCSHWKIMKEIVRERASARERERERERGEGRPLTGGDTAGGWLDGRPREIINRLSYPAAAPRALNRTKKQANTECVSIRFGPNINNWAFKPKISKCTEAHISPICWLQQLTQKLKPISYSPGWIAGAV